MQRLNVLLLVGIVAVLALVGSASAQDPTPEPGSPQLQEPFCPSIVEIEEIILDDMNRFRTANGPVPLVPSESLRNVACAHARDLASRNLQSFGDPYSRQDNNGVITQLDDWLDASNYADYPETEYRGSTDIFVHVSGNIKPEAIIEQMNNSPQRFLSYRALQLGNEFLPFYSRRYREVGVVYLLDERTRTQFYVFVFGAEPDSFPVSISPASDTSKVVFDRGTIREPSILVNIADEANPTRTSVGSVERMRVSELPLTNQNNPCRDDDTQPPFIFYASNQPFELSLSPGSKTIYVQLCDRFGSLAETQISVNFAPTIATATYTSTPTVTPTFTETILPTPTFTETETPTPTPTSTFTETPTVTPSVTPTETVMPTVEATSTQPTPTLDTPTATHTLTPTVTPSILPTNTETLTPTATATITPSQTDPTATFTVVPTVQATATTSPSNFSMHWREGVFVIANPVDQSSLDVSDFVFDVPDALNYTPYRMVEVDVVDEEEQAALQDVRPGSCIVIYDFAGRDGVEPALEDVREFAVCDRIDSTIPIYFAPFWGVANKPDFTLRDAQQVIAACTTFNMSCVVNQAMRDRLMQVTPVPVPVDFELILRWTPEFLVISNFNGNLPIDLSDMTFAVPSIVYEPYRPADVDVIEAQPQRLERLQSVREGDCIVFFWAANDTVPTIEDVREIAQCDRLNNVLPIYSAPFWAITGQPPFEFQLGGETITTCEAADLTCEVRRDQ